MDNEYASKRQQMVHTLIQQGIRDPKVLDAFRKVPRHVFLDEALWPQAYDDHPSLSVRSRPYRSPIWSPS